ncbi:hypothetical protein J19TS2_32410 [Cohnella xylanilytica]|nr:hypothetical protein J19TS2_32410 [Cohnella xylanilytica]
MLVYNESIHSWPYRTFGINENMTIGVAEIANETPKYLIIVEIYGFIFLYFA